MSGTSVARPPVAPLRRGPRHDPEAIALRIHQIASTAGVLAGAASRLDDDGPSLSHALYLIEECLLDVQERVEELAMYDRTMAKHPKRPRDPNQLATLILDMTTGEVSNDSPKGPDSAATQARRKGGLKGGKARAEKLSPTKRKVIARRAAAVRWANRTPPAIRP